MDRLSPLDAVFVDAEDEDRHTSMAIASVGVFEGPVPAYEELYQAVSGRLAAVPIYRRKLRTVPFRLGRPVWVDDPDFDLRYHIRSTALPAPGGDEQLSRLLARVMGQRLDRDYPLWEYWLVSGLAGERWALISKLHHCMADGISGTDLYRAVFDVTPEPSPPVPDDRVAGPEPSAISLAAQAALDLAMLPVRDASLVRGVLANPGDALRQVAGTGRAIARMVPSLRLAPGSSLSGQIGQQRRHVWVRASLAEIKAVKGELGGTVNDVVLAAISGGFRSLLLARGEEPDPHKVPSLVPVSVRAKGDESVYENQVSGEVAYLPVHIADPVERLAAVRAELASLKASREERVGEALISLGHYAPFPVVSRGVRFALSLPQREIVTVTTNVPGPPFPLYAMGRRMVELVPFVPLGSRVRIGVAIISYDGNVVFGVTGDYDANPDLDVLARGIEDGLCELLAAAGHPRTPAAGGQPPEPAAARQPRKPAATRQPRKPAATRQSPEPAAADDQH